jgi:hypothetical protein
MHRRRFLAASAAAVTAASLPFRSFAEGPGKNVISEQSLGPYLQGRMTAAVFARHIGSTFYAELAHNQTATLTLERAGDLDELRTAAGTPSARTGTTQRAVQRRGATATSSSSGAIHISGFYLAFRIRGPLTEQGTYLLDHAQLGHMAVFLVPGLQETCTAVFTTAPGS